ncbi:hypothetical protein Pla123a_48380 [Posidoniimonas polymericola]|uniref:Outer membrane protein beta-barrel domain-containing protein n=1 Tax=Posidoniimonas polymericola TaxID=2528002 RepID=A0A5C5XRU9_9BACT|nr:hypothetical protein [Posidoniimonas polymericola]TWT65927.1 hypothetical protein Pla123a_48380 [Posidoniimonas polymericola]
MKRLTQYAVLLLLVGAAASVGQTQQLEEFRQSAHTPQPEEPKPAKRRRSFYDCEDDPFDDLKAMVVFGVLAAPYYLPYAAFDQPGCDRFESYAAEQRQIAYKDTNWFCNSTNVVASARAQVDYGTDFSGLEQIGTKLQVDLPVWRLTLDGSISSYYEQLAAGGEDHLAIGDANLVFRFAQGERIVWRSGVGMNWLADTHNEAGFNFTYGLDAMPWEPVVFSTEIDLGTLGHERLLRSRTTLGLQWREVEVYTGYEYVEAGSAGLSTMLFGVRGWW